MSANAVAASGRTFDGPDPNLPSPGKRLSGIRMSAALVTGSALQRAMGSGSGGHFRDERGAGRVAKSWRGAPVETCRSS